MSVLPVWVQWLIVAAAVLAFARAGRPADRPITDRVTEAKAYRKLTAELVRRALMSVQLAAINSAVAKDPSAISFPVEIHRDGPGHLAIVDLPFGVEAADVCARRGRLASACGCRWTRSGRSPRLVIPAASRSGSATSRPLGRSQPGR